MTHLAWIFPQRSNLTKITTSMPLLMFLPMKSFCRQKMWEGILRQRLTLFKRMQVCVALALRQTYWTRNPLMSEIRLIGITKMMWVQSRKLCLL